MAADDLDLQAPCLAGIPVKDASADKKNPKSFKAVFQKSKIWPLGTSDTTSHKNKILITFCSDCKVPEAWSSVGIDSRDSSVSSPSMALGFVDPPKEDFEFDGVKYPNSLFENEPRNYYDKNPTRWLPGATVVHEFCHALGMLHEHQNGLPNSQGSVTNPLKLIEKKVIEYYTQANMTEADAKFNVLDRYNCAKGSECDYEGSTYDPDSIMLYAVPDNWVEGPNPTKPNFKLSPTDKHWLTKQYPFPDNKESAFPIIKVSFIDKEYPNWKAAWVIKTIKEQLSPVVCVGFKFIMKDPKDSTKTKQYDIFPEGIKYKSNTQSVTEGFSSGTGDKKRNLLDKFGNDEQIINKIDPKAEKIIGFISNFVVILFGILFIILLILLIAAFISALTSTEFKIATVNDSSTRSGTSSARSSTRATSGSRRSKLLQKIKSAKLKKKSSS